MINAEEHLDRKICEIAADIQQMLGSEVYRNLFWGLFWKRYINCIILDAIDKMPEMILLLRATKDAHLFAMIICFLNLDYGWSRMTLKYVLNEWQPRQEEA